MVARLVYTDLIMDFIPAVGTYPSIINTTAIIKGYYIASYTAIYGDNTYVETATDPVIDTEGFKGFLNTLVSLCVKELAEEKKRPMGPTLEEMYEIANYVPFTVSIPSFEDDDLIQKGDGQDG